MGCKLCNALVSAIEETINFHVNIVEKHNGRAIIRKN